MSHGDTYGVQDDLHRQQAAAQNVQGTVICFTPAGICVHHQVARHHGDEVPQVSAADVVVVEYQTLHHVGQCEDPRQPGQNWLTFQEPGAYSAPGQIQPDGP